MEKTSVELKLEDFSRLGGHAFHPPAPSIIFPIFPDDLASPRDDQFQLRLFDNRLLFAVENYLAVRRLDRSLPARDN